GAENFFLFGLTTTEVMNLQQSGYRPWEYYQNNEELKAVIDLINSGFFAHGDPGLFRPLTDNLLSSDPFLVLADFAAYVECQKQVGRAYLNVDQWTKMSILNVARMGKFSSDRSIREYCQDIWNIQPVNIELQDLCPDGQCLLIR
ncbi:MAG: glycogen/starch/alpha-glucan phosphorylase, partial [Microcystaceae cyanobacterium]